MPPVDTEAERLIREARTICAKIRMIIARIEAERTVWEIRTEERRQRLDLRQARREKAAEN